jgi:hypothetical protein
MRRTHATPWGLVLAALLVPAALHAQSGKDSNSTAAAQNAGGSPSGVETGRVDTTAKEAGSRLKPDVKSKKAKRPEQDADTAANRPYSPY